MSELEFDKSIEQWDEALPIGNGLLGNLIWGNHRTIKFSLDRGDLWDTRMPVETQSENFNYKYLIQCVKEKKQEEIISTFSQFYNKFTPTKLPAGRIEFDIKDREIKDVKFALDIKSATAEVIYNTNRKAINIKTFLHSDANYGCALVKNLSVAECATLVPPNFGVEGEANEIKEYGVNTTRGKLSNIVYPKVECHEEKGLKYFIQRTTEALNYGIFMAYRKMSDDEELIIYTVASNKDDDAWVENTINQIEDALQKEFDQLLGQHQIYWHKFWNKSQLSIPDLELQKMWELSNYFLGSCSRKNAPPMPLQGVWTADNGLLPPWKGDYHHDLNTQLSYLHYLKSNHIEEGETFIDFLWNLVPEAKAYAKTFFDADGLCLPSTMTIDGKPIGGWAMYTYNMTNQIWLCQMFERHWNYTGDDDFLREKAYVYFKETATCILRWLRMNEKSQYELPLSSSPEIHDNELEAWLKPNSNYDLALLRYLFKTLIKFAQILDLGEAHRWQEIYNHLPELAVNEESVLMLSSNESLKESHRHHSHAMAIFPLDLLNYNGREEDREIIDATISNLELLGTGLWVGYSFTWFAELYARQGNGEGAAYQLKLFFENFCSQNGFHLNGDYKNRGLSTWHYRPFTLEGNMCAADALQEMLLQVHEDTIYIFPAIPEEWLNQKVNFKNFRGPRGLSISAEMNENKEGFIEISPIKDGEYTIYNNFQDKYIWFETNQGRQIITSERNLYKLHLEGGKTYTFLVGEV